MTTQAPFDAAAAGYDAQFSDSRLGRMLRDSVRRLLGDFGPGQRVLEIGCGTGADAVWLAERGVDVVASDQSPAMLETTRKRATKAGVDLQTAVVDIGALPDGLDNRLFDGVISNFGPLNCVADRKPLARWLAERCAPGARLVLVVMGPICPWEIGWYALAGDLRSATRRFRSGGIAHAGGGGEVRVWYPSPRKLRAEFAEFFEPIGTRGVGVLLPPSDAAHVVDRAPRLFNTLGRIERRIDRLPGVPWLGDHYVQVFLRRP